MSSVSHESGEEEEEKVEIFKYLTQESIIQPNNERTQKIRREKREREMLLKQEQDEQERMRKALDNEQKEKDKQLKDRLRAEAEKRKLQEIKKEEEIIELKDLKGNFAKTVLEIRANVTSLEMVMTGTEFTPVQRRLIYKSLEKNTSLKVSQSLLRTDSNLFLGVFIEQKINQ